MDLRLITVRLDPETGTFPESPLAGLDGEVVDVVEHFFHHDGVPRLLLIVHLREPAERASGQSRRRDRADAAAALDPSERELYERLRAWRNGRAQTDGVPPYVILTNSTLAAVARARPRSLPALKAIPGIGDWAAIASRS